MAQKHKKIKSIKNNTALDSEFGHVPKGWTIESFGSVFTFMRSQAFSRENLTGEKTKSGIQNIHYGDIHSKFNNEILDLSLEAELPYIKEDSLNGNIAEYLMDGDLIIADVSEDYEGVGECVELKNVSNKKIVGGLHTFVARDVNGKTADGFRCYIFKNPFVRTSLKKIATGSNVYGISKTNLSEIKIIIPSLPEQRKIASILSTWDKAIDLTEKLILTKETFKSALVLKSIVGDIRFPEFKKDNWKQLSIKELGTVVSGGTPDTTNPDFWDGDIDWCTPTEITALEGGKYLRNTGRKITEAGFKNSSANLLPIHSVIVCTRATVGACAINKVPMTTNQGFKSIIPKNIDTEFLFYLIMTLKKKLLSIACGSTFLEVPKTDFENIIVDIPSSKIEQEKISSLLSSCDIEIQLLKAQLTKLRQQKVGLMEAMLTGKNQVVTE